MNPVQVARLIRDAWATRLPTGVDLFVGAPTQAALSSRVCIVAAPNENGDGAIQSTFDFDAGIGGRAVVTHLVTCVVQVVDGSVSREVLDPVGDVAMQLYTALFDAIDASPNLGAPSVVRALPSINSSTSVWQDGGDEEMPGGTWALVQFTVSVTEQV